MTAQPTERDRERARELRQKLLSEHAHASFKRRFDEEIAQALADAREAALREAAEVVDQCNREGPYNAIGAASRIRALIGDANG